MCSLNKLVKSISMTSQGYSRIGTDENNMNTNMWTVLLTTIGKKSITRLETTVR